MPFKAFKESQSDILNIGLGAVNDLNIEYRTVSENYGSKFHDRFLILKHEINGVKVWSLGASINSIGSKHCIIQAVANPVVIRELFNDMWEETNNELCKIFLKKSELPNK